MCPLENESQESKKVRGEEVLNTHEHVSVSVFHPDGTLLGLLIWICPSDSLLCVKWTG